jgi:hypothetical protein
VNNYSLRREQLQPPRHVMIVRHLLVGLWSQVSRVKALGPGARNAGGHATREVRLMVRNTRNENNFYPSHENWMVPLS